MSATTVGHVKDGVRGIYVGRANRTYGLPGSVWANPFSGPDKAQNLALYAEWLRTHPYLLHALPTLRGKHLKCWCVTPRDPDADCHARILKAWLDAYDDDELHHIATLPSAMRPGLPNALSKPGE